MATNIEINPDLMDEVQRLTGLRSKKAAVEAGLRALLLLHAQKEVRDLRGRLHWTEGREPWMPEKKKR